MVMYWLLLHRCKVSQNKELQIASHCDGTYEMESEQPIATEVLSIDLPTPCNQFFKKKGCESLIFTTFQPFGYAFITGQAYCRPATSPQAVCRSRLPRPWRP